MSRIRWYGSLERDAVPALDDHVRRRADAEARTGRARPRPATPTLWAMQRRARGCRRGRWRVPSRSVGRPRRGQRERREAVGAVGLARPDVGVAEVGQLLDQLPLLVQRDAVEGDGHAVALHASARCPCVVRPALGAAGIPVTPRRHTSTP